MMPSPSPASIETYYDTPIDDPLVIINSEAGTQEEQLEEIEEHKLGWDHWFMIFRALYVYIYIFSNTGKIFTMTGKVMQTNSSEMLKIIFMLLCYFPHWN